MPAFLTAQDGEALFKTGLDFFEKGDFKQAAENFERIRENGNGHSPELYFNLGNCFLKLRQPGRAVLNYERALRLAPRFEPARQNLELIRQSLADDFGEADVFFLAKFWAKIRDSARAETWGWLTIFLGFLTAASLVFRSSASETQSGASRRIFGLVAPLFLASFFLAKNAADRLQNSREAIVLTEKTGVFSSPDPKSEQLAEIHEGSKIGLEDKIDNWLKVRLPDGEIGWLSAGDVEKI